jgi:D-lactate dehydrogenase (cytochrome)
MKDELGAEALDAMRAIKRAMDPDNILNPGKILPQA